MNRTEQHENDFAPIDKKSGFDDLEKVIDYIQMVYTQTTDEWMRHTTLKFNFKKSMVSEIETNGLIYKSMMAYIRFLNERSAGISLQLSFVCSSQVTARVKAQNSVEYKLQNYKTEQHEFGKVAINKCFNDLFGARIILEEASSFEDICKFIEEKYHGKYKCIDSSKLDYRAVHLYFRDNNYSYPWELQIWNRCDVESNFDSHKKYKQEYTTWEKESKEGGLVDG